MSFRDWVGDHARARTAELLSIAAGVYTFHHDPGELSASFVWERTVRTLLSKPTVRYVTGGWTRSSTRSSAAPAQLGVEIETGHRVDALPAGPVVVATELATRARCWATSR